MLFSLVSLLFALPLVLAASIHTPHDSHDDHAHEINQALPGTWYQDPDHPVHSLFKRAPGDGTDYPAVGTPQWSQGFPSVPPNPADLPAEWVAALNAAVASGQVPNIPQSTNTPQTNPTYPQGVNPNGPEVCSATYKCRIPGDIWNAPDGVFASSFDDGPLPPTTALVAFLQSQNLKTTHFMIGVNIIRNPTQFLTAFDAGHDIAVHTWSHPYMTTLSNLDIVGQLGWTMQLIHNSTGGRVPRYWRPPYGDSDMRVRSIAKAVFGMDTVIWNQDTLDWSQAATQPIQDSMTRFLGMPKSPGLMVLEHETSDITVNGFINSFPQIAGNGWSFRSLADVMSNGTSYQNAASSGSAVTKKGILANSPVSTSSTATAAPSTTSSPTSISSPPPTSIKSSAAPGVSHHTLIVSLVAGVVSALLAFSS